MEALRSIPKVIQGVQDIQSDPYKTLAEYRQNMRLFIDSVTKEVSAIIDQYERKIAELKEENRMLKIGKGDIGDLPLRTAVKKGREEREYNSNKFIHSGKRSPNLEMMQTAKSTMFAPFANGFEDDIKLSAILSKYKRGRDEDSNFPVELINPEPGEDDDFGQGKSQFQIKSNRKKQREEELRNFLETGKKSLNHTTKRFLESIGRNNMKQNDDREGQGEQRDHSDSSLSLKKNESSALNASLGNICNSLDNSFVAKRARSNKSKKSSQIEDEIKRKQKQEEEMTKMMKSKGIKNLLHRLRENVEASPKKELQIIKSSKLISCGPSPSNEIPLTNSRKNSSKVMINPVPVDIVRKSMVSKKERSSSPQPFSPARKPQSILKQSTIMPKEPNSPTKSILKQTSTILSKSISGISAIEFAD